MSCDYYIQHDIVINYYSINGIIEEYKKQLKLRLDNYIYEIIFYDNGEWNN